MTFGGSMLVVAGLLFLTGCTEVTVQVPPEVDLQAAGITTVAIVAADLPGDPSPVATLLRAEASAHVRRVLPALAIVGDPEQADAVLQMAVANHGVGPANFQRSANAQGQASCDAWQEAFLIVDASVFSRGKPSSTWEALIEKRARIDLTCTPKIDVPLWTAATPAVSDPQMVSAVVRELGMRLAGYTKHELRPR